MEAAARDGVNSSSYSEKERRNFQKKISVQKKKNRKVVWGEELVHKQTKYVVGNVWALFVFCCCYYNYIYLKEG